LNLDKKDEEKILAHELAHIQGKHSYDILLVEILGILMWCSPLIFLYKRSLRNVHEYLADAQVLQNTQKKQYGQLLLRQFQSGYSIALANHFNHSQLKKRFDMMMKNKSPRRALIKYLPLLPLAAVLLMAFSFKPEARLSQWEELSTSVSNSNFDPEVIKQKIQSILVNFKNAESKADQKGQAKELYITCMFYGNQYPEHKKEIVQLIDQVIHETNSPFIIGLKDDRILCMQKGAKESFSELQNGVYSTVEKMPKFPGCELTNVEAEDKPCADKEMLMFIYKNIKYPKEARKNNVEGIVVVRFIVDATGKIILPEIIRSIGSGCDEAVLDIVKQMPQWIPGEDKGEKVSVYFNLPVRFKLQGKKKPEKAEKEEKAEEIEIPKESATIMALGNDKPEMEVFNVVEEMPRFKGCEDIADKKERKECSDKKMLNYIYKNIKYPKEATKEGIEGVVVVNFLVDKTGNLVKAQIKRSIGGGCDEEVLRVINSMDAWIPGKQRGKAVNVQMNIPVKFKLAPKSETKVSKANNLQLEAFTAFPNPTSDQLTIRFKGPKGPTVLSVYDAAGKVAFKSEIQLDGPFEKIIDLGSLAKGAVFISVSQGEQEFVEKVIYQ